MRVLLACSLLAWAAAAAPADDPKDKTNAEKLVGTWKLVASSQGAPKDVTFLVGFTKDGKMTLRVEPKEKDAEAIVLKGTYKLDKDKIDYTIDNGAGGQKQEVLTIKTLTADDLVTVDPDGIKEEFKRVKEKKEKK